MITVVDWNDGQRWDDFVHSVPDGTVCHLYAWGEIINRAYGHRCFYLAATDKEKIQGVLPLVLIESRLFGRNLVSMPFMDYGGPLTFGGAPVREALVDAALELGREHRATLALRCSEDMSLKLAPYLEKVTMLLELGSSGQELWKRLPSERRNRIRKGQKNGLVATFHRTDALEPFYSVFARNMRDLGSPVHSRAFFRQMFEHLSRYLHIILVSYRKQVVGAAAFFLYKDKLTIPGWISCLREFFHLSPNAVLHWELMRFGISRGCHVLDFGRSTLGTGTFEAKRQWHATPTQLYYYYSPTVVSSDGEQNPYSRQVDLWRRLPLFVANAIGPTLRGSIPN